MCVHAPEQINRTKFAYSFFVCIPSNVLQPSASPPRFHITFVHDGTSRTLNVHLPALLPCFVQPVPMTAAAFDAKWSKLRTDKGQEKDVFMVPKGEGAIRWLLATGMQLSVVGAPDSTDVSSSALATPIYASGVFRCLGFPRGFGCLLRIEFRVSAWPSCTVQCCTACRYLLLLLSNTPLLYHFSTFDIMTW